MYTTRSLYTRANYEVNQSTQWRMLSDDQIENIFLTAVEILERTGAEVLNQDAQKLLENAGCWVDGNRVRIPSALSEWAVRTAPSRITLCDRNGKRALRLEATNAYYGPGQGNGQVLDPMTGELRKPVVADVANTALLCDGLKNVDFAMSNGLPTDVDAAKASVAAFEALVSNTTKPIVQAACGTAQMQAIIDMAAAVAGGLKELQKNPFLALYVEAEGTLAHSDDAMAQVMLAAKNKIPCIYAPKLVAGDTAPASPAGAVVVALADVLVGILVAQLVCQGAPVIAGAQFSIAGEADGVLPVGAPEVSLMGTGMSNVLCNLKVPSFGFAGATDSKLSDAQMGAEAAFSILHNGLAGTNLICGAGQMESGLTGSLDLLVMGDEVMGMIRRILEGVEVNEDRLARGVIDEVQPGGHYLGEEHTLDYFKAEFWWPKLLNRSRIDDWTAAGAKTLGQRCNDRTQSILKTHQPEKLSDDAAAQIKAIVAKA